MGGEKSVFNVLVVGNMDYEAVNPDVLSVDALKARQLVYSVLEMRTLRVLGLQSGQMIHREQLACRHTGRRRWSG